MSFKCTYYTLKFVVFNYQLSGKYQIVEIKFWQQKILLNKKMF